MALPILLLLFQSVIPDALYSFGGDKGPPAGKLNRIAKYDIATDKWTILGARLSDKAKTTVASLGHLNEVSNLIFTFGQPY